MTNYDRITSMTNDELASFILKWQVNLVAEVFTNGFINTLHYQQLKEWLQADANPHAIFEKWEEE